MQDLSVTLIQTDLFWEDIPGNLAAFGRKIDRDLREDGSHRPAGDVHHGLYHECRKTWPSP